MLTKEPWYLVERLYKMAFCVLLVTSVTQLLVPVRVFPKDYECCIDGALLF